MPAPILNMGATVMCAHTGRATLLPNSKVMLGGQPAVQWAPELPIVGCINPTPPANTGPDVMAPLLPVSFTTKVLSNGMPLLVGTLAGVPVPSGVPLLPAVPGQIKVIAT